VNGLDMQVHLQLGAFLRELRGRRSAKGLPLTITLPPKPGSRARLRYTATLSVPHLQAIHAGALAPDAFDVQVITALLTRWEATADAH
jgi:hypothetical protein